MRPEYLVAAVDREGEKGSREEEQEQEDEVEEEAATGVRKKCGGVELPGWL